MTEARQQPEKYSSSSSLLSSSKSTYSENNSKKTQFLFLGLQTSQHAHTTCQIPEASHIQICPSTLFH